MVDLQMVGPLVASLCMYVVEDFTKRVCSRAWSSSSPQRLLVGVILVTRVLSHLWEDILVDCFEDFM